MSAHALWTSDGACGSVSVDGRRFAVGLEWGARALASEAARALLHVPARDGSGELLALHPVGSGLQPATGRRLRGHGSGDASLGSLLALSLPDTGLQLLVCGLDDDTIYWLAVHDGVVVPGSDRVLADRGGALEQIRNFASTVDTPQWHVDSGLGSWLGVLGGATGPGISQRVSELRSQVLGAACLARRARAGRRLRASFAVALVGALVGAVAILRPPQVLDVFGFSPSEEVAQVPVSASLSQPSRLSLPWSQSRRPSPGAWFAWALRVVEAQPGAVLDARAGLVWVADTVDVGRAGDVLVVHERALRRDRVRTRTLSVPESADALPVLLGVQAPVFSDALALDPGRGFAELLAPLPLLIPGLTMRPDRIELDPDGRWARQGVELVLAAPIAPSAEAALDAVPGLVVESLSYGVTGDSSLSVHLHAVLDRV